MFNIKLTRQARTDDTCISSGVVSLSHAGDRLISGQFYGCPRGTCFLLKLDSRCAEISTVVMNAASAISAIASIDCVHVD